MIPEKDKITLVLDRDQFTLLLNVLLSYDDEGPAGHGWQSKKLNALYNYVCGKYKKNRIREAKNE